MVVTPLGPGMAHFIWSPSNDDSKWGIFQDQTGECWWWDNHLIRMQPTISYGRFKTSPIGEKTDLTEALVVHRVRHATPPKV